MYKFPNELRLRILGNQEISGKPLKCLDLIASTQPSTQKSNFDIFWSKLTKKSPVKHSIEKPSFLNFESLSPTLCTRLSEETYFHFWLSPDPFILHFLKILVFEKTHLLFKLIFKATELQKNAAIRCLSKNYFALLRQVCIWD